MTTKEALGVYLKSLDSRSYYDILRVPPDGDDAAIKSAFHDFSLLYHPDCHVGSPSEVIGTTAEIYKRGVEAYRCLSRAASREKYDRALAGGKIRIDTSHVSVPPPPPPLRTLEAIAGTPRGKQFAIKADRLIAIGNLEDARLQLVSACQCEPYNEELSERLQVLYEALALEPM